MEKRAFKLHDIILREKLIGIFSGIDIVKKIIELLSS